MKRVIQPRATGDDPINKILRSDESIRSTKSNYPSYRTAILMGQLKNRTIAHARMLQKLHFMDTGEQLDFPGLREKYSGLEIMASLHDDYAEEFLSVSGFSINKAVEFSQSIQRVEANQTYMGSTPEIPVSDEKKGGVFSWFK